MFVLSISFNILNLIQQPNQHMVMHPFILDFTQQSEGRSFCLRTTLSSLEKTTAGRCGFVYVKQVDAIKHLLCLHFHTREQKKSRKIHVACPQISPQICHFSFFFFNTRVHNAQFSTPCLIRDFS